MKTIKDNINYLENNGYIVMSKIELDSIVKNAKLGKKPVVNPKGKIIGWRE